MVTDKAYPLIPHLMKSTDTAYLRVYGTFPYVMREFTRYHGKYSHVHAPASSPTNQ